jgi:hypothetical protein
MATKKRRRPVGPPPVDLLRDRSLVECLDAAMLLHLRGGEERRANINAAMTALFEAWYEARWRRLRAVDPAARAKRDASRATRAREGKKVKDDAREEYVVGRYFAVLRTGVTPKRAREVVAEEVARGRHIIAAARSSRAEARKSASRKAGEAARRQLADAHGLVDSCEFKGFGTYSEKSVLRVLKRHGHA